MPAYWDIQPVPPDDPRAETMLERLHRTFTAIQCHTGQWPEVWVLDASDYARLCRELQQERYLMTGVIPPSPIEQLFGVRLMIGGAA